MADLGTIGIAIEVRGREAIRQIENDMTAVDRSAKSAARSFEAFERAGLKTAETFTYMSEASKRRLTEEARITQELVKQRAAAEQLAKVRASGFQSQIGSNLGLGAQGISAGASAGAFEGEIERLRQKYDSIYASSQLYERSLQELNKAHMLGVTSAKQHESAVEQLNAEYQAFQNGTANVYNRFAQNIQQTGSGLNNAGVLMQQLGYQAGDFIVQVQSGTNAFVAFGQQATQLVGFLPMLAAETGLASVAFMGLNISMATLTLGLSIIIPLLTAAGALWMRTSESSNVATESVNRQAQAYDNLISKVEGLRLQRQMETTGIQTKDEQILQNELNRLLEERVVIQDRLNKLKNAGGRAAGYAQEKQDELDLLQTQLDKNQAVIDALSYEQTLSIAARRRANEQRNDYREARAAADDLYDRLFQITQIDLGSVFSEASPFAQNLLSTVKGLYESMQRAAQVAAIAASGVAGRVGDTDRGGQRTQVRSAAEYNTSVIMERLNPEPIRGGVGSSKRQTELRKEIDLTKELTQAEKDRQSIVNSVNSSLESGFMAMVDGTSSVKDAFKSMATEIIKELYRVLVVQRLVSGITNALGLTMSPTSTTTSFGTPNFFGGGRASGGSMMAGNAYLVGEHGPELVIPRHSGTVVNANQTAGTMGNGGAVTVQNNITVTGSDAAMVRAEVAKMIPQISNATKAAIIDAKQRGGQMAQAFR